MASNARISINGEDRTYLFKAISWFQLPPAGTLRGGSRESALIAHTHKAKSEADDAMLRGLGIEP